MTINIFLHISLFAKATNLFSAIGHPELGSGELLK